MRIITALKLLTCFDHQHMMLAPTIQRGDPAIMARNTSHSTSSV